MGSYKQHLFFGFVSVCLYLVVAYSFFGVKYSVFDVLYFTILTAIFSLFPDIDSDSSKIRKFVNFGLILVCLGCVGYYFFVFKNPMFIWIGVSSVIGIGLLYFTSHRGFTHSIIASLIFTSPFLYFGIQYFAVSFIAYLSHLLLDS